MRKKVYGIMGSALLLGALLSLGAVNEASAGVNLGINVNIGPPPIVVPAPPDVVMVPGSQVYFVPGVQFDVFFYNGFWWSPRGDRWYRARAYNGPWGVVDRRYVPRPVFGVPHDYRHMYARERHIPYGEWRGRHEGRGHEGGGHDRGGEFRGEGEHGGGHGHER
ncbi:MAG TPA: hypothetical protein VF799_12035 [Geobacteraceae bacterium]